MYHKIYLYQDLIAHKNTSNYFSWHPLQQTVGQGDGASRSFLKLCLSRPKPGRCNLIQSGCNDRESACARLDP
jgi:hypothetical protein